MSPGSLSPLPSWWSCHPPLQNLREMPNICPIAKIHSFNQYCPIQSRPQSVRSFYVKCNEGCHLLWPFLCLWSWKFFKKGKHLTSPANCIMKVMFFSLQEIWHVYAKQIGALISENCNKPVLLGLALKKHSPQILQQILTLLQSNRVWWCISSQQSGMWMKAGKWKLSSLHVFITTC